MVNTAVLPSKMASPGRSRDNFFDCGNYVYVCVIMRHCYQKNQR